jgi:hypothetical protein
VGAEVFVNGDPRFDRGRFSVRFLVIAFHKRLRNNDIYIQSTGMIAWNVPKRARRALEYGYGNAPQTLADRLWAIIRAETGRRAGSGFSEGMRKGKRESRPEAARL